MSTDSSNKNEAYASSRVKREESRVERYSNRRSAKHEAEMNLVARSFPALEKGAEVLDAPCGVGRLSIWMAEQGYTVKAMDLGEAAVNRTQEIAKERHLAIDAQQGDMFNMTWNDGHFNAAVCFRVLHHFNDRDIRRKLVTELARVTGNHLLISYLSPSSFTGLKRRIRAAMGGKVSLQNHTPLSELKEDMNNAGFEFVKDSAQSRFFHSLHLAHFQRK